MLVSCSRYWYHTVTSTYPHRPARKVRAERQQPVLGQGGKSPARLPSVVPGHGVISLSFSLHWAWLFSRESSSRPWLFYLESLILIWHALRGESAECHLLIFSTGDESSTSEDRCFNSWNSLTGRSRIFGELFIWSEMKESFALLAVVKKFLM